MDERIAFQAVVPKFGNALCQGVLSPESGRLIMFQRLSIMFILLTGFNVETYGMPKWFRISPEFSPPPMEGHNMVFEESQGVCLLYGWFSWSRENPPMFQYNGSNWTQIDPSGDWPIARSSFGMAYDPEREIVVVFGGFQGGFDYLGDTWEWDGTQWTEMNPSNKPTDRLGSRMIYFLDLSRIVLFGGYDESLTRRNDTWAWDGTEWTEIDCSVSPEPRNSFGCVYDSHRNVMVIFGGNGEGRVRRDDTWEFDGESWHEVNTEHRPGVRDQLWMAYDQKRQKTVLFSGSAPSDFWEDTWEYDGTDWNEIEVHPQPVGRANTAMCYDSFRERIVLFGGYAWGELNDTWEYYEPPTPTPTVTPTSPPTSSPSPSPASSPSSTPTPPCPLGVTLSMPSHQFQPGDPCSLTATLCNASSDTLTQTPFFCILDILGEYWFNPTWSEHFDGVLLESIEPGTIDITVIEPFYWPDNAGSFDNARFIAAMTDPSVTNILGVSGEWVFSWGR